MGQTKRRAKAPARTKAAAAAATADAEVEASGVEADADVSGNEADADASGVEAEAPAAVATADAAPADDAAATDSETAVGSNGEGPSDRAFSRLRQWVAARRATEGRDTEDATPDAPDAAPADVSPPSDASEDDSDDDVLVEAQIELDDDADDDAAATHEPAPGARRARDPWIARPQGPRTVVDYGVDAPHVVGRVAMVSAAAVVVLLLSAVFGLPTWVSLVALVLCIVFALAALLLLWSSKVGKLYARERLVHMLDLDDDSWVLDAGCGTGSVLVEVAHEAPDGFVVGIDLWEPVGNVAVTPEVPLANARFDGVDHQVAITTGDVRRLPFRDEMFDAVGVSLVLGRLTNTDARLEAARELARVLLPGGHLVLLERKQTRALVHGLRDLGLEDAGRTRPYWRLLPPARFVIATKPSPGSDHDADPEPDEDPEHPG